MRTQSKYKTRQREELIAYLKSLPGQHVTAADAAAWFRAQGKSIGLATVYRQLESLVDEGIVTKYLIDAGSPACFAYVGLESHGDPENCFHCKCEKCGKLIHLHCEELEGVEKHLYETHRFTLNPLRSVFYGICEDCAKGGESDAR